MDSVLTLIAGPATLLDAEMVFAARAALRALGNDTGAPDWLAPDRACDLPFTGFPDQADAAVRRILAGAPIDMIAQPTDSRRKRLLVADMESTIIRQELIDELAALSGVGERVAAITRAAMNGERDFVPALRERVALLADLPVTALEEAWQRVEAMPGAATLIRTMRASGAWCVLVSGGLRFFTRRVATLLSFDDETGSDVEVVAGRLTGRVLDPITDPEGKVTALVRTAGAHRVPIKATLAVGDGANDLPMLEAAGLGIAFRAKPRVAALARTRIDHADLTALLFAQGYRADEFVG